MPGVVEVDAFKRGRETVRVALAADLTVRDDIEAGILLRANGQKRGVVLRLRQKRFRNPPQLLRADTRRKAARKPRAIDEPFGLRVTANKRRRKQGHRP